MKKQQLNQLIENLRHEGAIDLIETHISWILLGPEFVYKIKKPIKYSFLDFSTFSKRKFYCQKEVELNRRLAPDMYLGVVPISDVDGSIQLDLPEGMLIDCAVKMKRMDNTRQMDLLLREGKVTFKHMEQLAEQLSAFHAFAQVIETPLTAHSLWEDYADILKVIPFLKQNLSREIAENIQNSVSFATRFLDSSQNRILERHTCGYTIDGHGDLHSKNILLLEEPVVFDCIEFNDHFRQVDVINELAFFCLDLDFYKRPDLATHFLKQYLWKHSCIKDSQDWQLFTFYKLYRANVRVKVNALKAMQVEPQFRQRNIRLIETYTALMQRYVQTLTAP